MLESLVLVHIIQSSEHPTADVAGKLLVGLSVLFLDHLVHAALVPQHVGFVGEALVADAALVCARARSGKDDCAMNASLVRPENLPRLVLPLALIALKRARADHL